MVLRVLSFLPISHSTLLLTKLADEKPPLKSTPQTNYCPSSKRTNHRRTIVEPTTANERHDNLPTPPNQTIMAPRGRQTGRIHPHQRQTDDTTTTIAGEGISAEHQSNVFDKATKPQTMNHLHLQQQNHEQQSNLPHRSNLEARTGTTILRSSRYVSYRIRILLLLAVPKLQQ